MKGGSMQSLCIFQGRSLLVLVSFNSYQDRSPTPFSGGSVSGNSTSNGVTISKVTPKAVLKMMDSDGLTIFHVKSHLQKYRIAKYMLDPIYNGKSDKRIHIKNLQHQYIPLDIKRIQIREALQQQLDAQKLLHKQLEE
ncbi:myb family transcription factor PHL5-like isoform X4 [Arachis stenosperma]|uniref:myb family transcription factor PHL5-like isoform X4 n=1 Tax=Arachis stenosperma TaxID=217475 RepID=UPI0025AB81CC|nr:myb family transcription factor PHL5-like isoform X4 [Arachis stenosperma]